MRSVELCAGVGGLALATTQAGFSPVALIENDPAACATIAENKRRGSQWVQSWPTVSAQDICKVDYSSINESVDLLSGGPPCQPFSNAGKLLGIEDDRDLFSEVARAMRELRPRAILIENTKGLACQIFVRQLEYIRLQLTFPEALRKPDEHWESFLRRLRGLAKSKTGQLRYTVSTFILDAADYGVGQRRERLIITAFRDETGSTLNAPAPTHSGDALLYAQWVTGEYWDRHKIPTNRRPRQKERTRARVRMLKEAGEKPEGLPWVTVRDVFASLPSPTDKKQARKLLNHQLQLGARSYDGHCGSCYDWPAKVLKAGRHGVPGGENMLLYPNGKVRYFTIRECARLQSFPDDYYFDGTWSKMTRHIGNAVPVLMCRRVADAIWLHLASVESRRKANGTRPRDAGSSRRKLAG